MADIFMSYAKEDKARAEQLAGALEREGYSVWWDRRIPAGKSFDQVIEEELTKASCAIVIWSQASAQSTWVKTEASAAMDRGMLFPVLLEDMVPPFAFRHIQAANLAQWWSDGSDPAFKQFIADLPPELRARRGSTQVASAPTPDATPPPPSSRPTMPTQRKAILLAVGVVILGIVIAVIVKDRMRHSDEAPVDVATATEAPATEVAPATDAAATEAPAATDATATAEPAQDASTAPAEEPAQDYSK